MEVEEEFRPRYINFLTDLLFSRCTDRYLQNVYTAQYQNVYTAQYINCCRYPRDVFTEMIYRTFLRRSNSAILYHMTSLVALTLLYCIIWHLWLLELCYIVSSYIFGCSNSAILYHLTSLVARTLLYFIISHLWFSGCSNSAILYHLTFLVARTLLYCIIWHLWLL